MRKRILVLFFVFLSLLSLSCCKLENKVLDLCKKNLYLEFAYNQIFEVADFEDVKVYLLHRKHENEGNYITIVRYDYAGDYEIVRDCPAMCFIVYSKTTKDVLYLTSACEEGLIKEEDLDSIAKGYNEALKKLDGHDKDTYDYSFVKYKNKS